MGQLSPLQPARLWGGLGVQAQSVAPPDVLLPASVEVRETMRDCLKFMDVYGSLGVRAEFKQSSSSHGFSPNC